MDDQVLQECAGYSSDSANVVTIEQGTHQPEDQVGGGFILHFTGRMRTAWRFTSTSSRDKTATLTFEITYMDSKHLRAANALDSPPAGRPGWSRRARLGLAGPPPETHRQPWATASRLRSFGSEDNA